MKIILIFDPPCSLNTVHKSLKGQEHTGPGKSCGWFSYQEFIFLSLLTRVASVNICPNIASQTLFSLGDICLPNANGVNGLLFIFCPPITLCPKERALAEPGDTKEPVRLF